MRSRRPAHLVAEGDAEPKAVPPLHSPGDRLAEAVGLAHAIDLDVAEALIVPVQAPRPSTLFGKGKVEEIGRPHRGGRYRAGGRRSRGIADPAAQSGKGLEREGARPHRSDPRDLRPASADARGPAAGRAGASELPEEPAGPQLDPSRAPARRRGLPRRPRRKPARARPPHDPGSHRRDPRGARRRRHAPASCIARAGARCRIRSSPSSATPTPASRRCSTASPAPACSPRTRCSRRSIRRCAR